MSQVLEDARAATLSFVETLDDATLTAWPEPSFSPLCWHLGHIAFTEAFWMLGRAGGDSSLSAPFAKRFAQDGCAKEERAEGYHRAELFDYLSRVRREVLQRLPTLDDPLCEEGYLEWFIACHEHQHRETMAIVLGLRATETLLEAPALVDEGDPPRARLGGGSFVVGTDARCAYDNERPATAVTVAPFSLDVHPVTAAAWARFMKDGGYQARDLWSDEGWRWRAEGRIERPRSWIPAGDGWTAMLPAGLRAIDGAQPVHGVSYHEAEAFARWRGGRLPTEVEWEFAAQQFPEGRVLNHPADGPRPVERTATPTDLRGNVWEWTSSWFEPREGFVAFPYRGYSSPYFQATHRVMKGGSFATHPAIANSHFRNWYEPHVREVYVGLRVAYDAHVTVQ